MARPSSPVSPGQLSLFAPADLPLAPPGPALAPPLSPALAPAPALAPGEGEGEGEGEGPGLSSLVLAPLGVLPVVSPPAGVSLWDVLDAAWAALGAGVPPGQPLVALARRTAGAVRVALGPYWPADDPALCDALVAAALLRRGRSLREVSLVLLLAGAGPPGPGARARLRRTLGTAGLLLRPAVPLGPPS